MQSVVFQLFVWEGRSGSGGEELSTLSFSLAGKELEIKVKNVAAAI